MTHSKPTASFGRRAGELRDVALRYGFPIVLVAIFLFFSLATPHFHEAGNLISLIHAMSPLMVIDPVDGFAPFAPVPAA